jgi:hypothetical protein
MIYTIIGIVAMIAVPLAAAITFGFEIGNDVLVRTGAVWAAVVSGAGAAIGLEVTGIYSGHLVMQLWPRRDGRFWLALVFLRDWFHTPVPAAAFQALQPAAPGALQGRWLLPALAAVLSPTLPDEAPAWRARLAARAVLLRYHLTRMPLRLLLPHAWHKLRAGQRPPAPDQEADLPGPRRADELK